VGWVVGREGRHERYRNDDWEVPRIAPSEGPRMEDYDTGMLLLVRWAF